MFEQAIRIKLRFNFDRGRCSIEDLWDLSVEELDSIYKRLNLEMKEQKEESLLKKKSVADEILELKINIVKHIVTIKFNEQKTRENETLRTERKQKLLSIIAEKQDEELKGKSIDELNELVNSL